MPAKPKIRVLIADPQLLFADALSCGLRMHKDIEVVEEHPRTGMAAVDMVELFRPDVVLVEYWMETMLAPAVVQAVRPRLPECKVLVLSWLHGSREILNSFYAGAVGFIPKNTTRVAQIAEAVREAHSGAPRVFSAETEKLLKALSERDEEAFALWEKMKGLSRRHLQILAMLSQAKSLKEIAESLSIMPKTARNHLDNMMRKTGAQSQLQLLAMARQCGLIAG